MPSSPIFRAPTRALIIISTCAAVVASLWLLSERARAAVFIHAARSVASVPANSVLTPPGSTITVNSTADVTNSSDGLCTLREAIVAANTDVASGFTAGECVAGSGDDTIDFSVTGTIDLSTALANISSNLIISGPGSGLLTVERSAAGGTPALRIFSIDSGKTVSISGLTASKGLTGSGDPNGGAILNNGNLSLTDCIVSDSQTAAGNSPGGGIYVALGATLTLTNSTVSGNQTGTGPSGGPSGGGGGIDNFGTATLINSTVSNNKTGPHGMVAGQGGGLYNGGTLILTNSTVTGNQTDNSFNSDGGGIFSASSVAVTNSTITNNKSGGGGGGGVYVSSGTATLTDCTISGNQASSGGGIGANSFQTTISISNCLVSNNTANTGGGIVSGDPLNALKIANTTISDNKSSGTGGGLVYSSAAVLTNVTITNNRSDSDNSGGEQGGGISRTSGTGLTLKNAIVAGNFRGTGTTPDDVNGTLNSSSSFNLIGTGGAGGLTDGVNNNQVGVADPRLGALANNGGPNLTYALLADSRAVDAGDNCVTQAAHCGDANIPQLTTDQRGAGFIRADDGNGDGSATVDIGAYEVQSILVTNTLDNGAGSLRDAITTANVNPDTNAINFQAGLTGTITLLSALPNLSTSMSINGPGAGQMTVQRSSGAGTNFGIFKSSPNAVIKISGLTIANGNQGGIFNDGGTFTIESCVVTGHSGATAIRNGFASGGTMTINNSTIINNTAGGIDNFVVTGSSSPPAILTINNSTISGNTSAGSFGGIENVVGSGGTARITINNSTVSGNTSSGGSGTGGVFNFVTLGGTAALVVNNSTIYGNNSNDASGTGGVEQHIDCVGPGASGCISTVRLLNTIVAGNLRFGSSPNDVSGTLDPASSFNLIGTGGSGGLTNGTNNNQVGVANPGLGPLGSNGGPTQTHALLPGSPAIDAGDNCVINNSCSPALASAIITDQRGVGFNRSADGNGDGTTRVDIGAFEIQSFLVINNGDSGAGSLRQAIIDANASSGTKAINFQTGVTGTINLLSVLPDLSTSMSINGPGAGLLIVGRDPGAGSFRILNVQTAVTVNISDLTISNGFLNNGSFPTNNGAGIFSSGTLTLNRVVVTGNTVNALSSGGGAGGIYNNNGTLTLINSTVSSNSALTGSGGGIVNNGTLILTNSIVNGNNTAGVGGGILNGSGTVTLINSTVSQNTAFSGGGADNIQTTTMRFINSTVSGNSNSGGDGGGILNTGNLTLINSTISNNSSTGSGGGILSPFGTNTLTNCTVSNNTATASSNAGGGGIYSFGNTFLGNTIVANNTISNGSGPDLKGNFISQDYNLIGNVGGASFTGTTTHNIINQSSLLAPLANNGGPTMTHALLPGSPAINAGSNTNLPADTFDLDGNGNTTEPIPLDQRGFGRVTNTAVDIGAFESRGFTMAATGGTPQSATITTAFGSPLAATVSSAFGEPVAGGSVTFTTPVSGASGTFEHFGATFKAVADVNGVATSQPFIANGTPGGPYNVVASGNGISSSALFSLTNTQAATSTSLVSSANPSDFGQSVTFTATVTSSIGAPTGSIQFKDGGTNLGSQALNGSGVAALSTSSMTAGSHTITAEYSGAANFVASSGALASAQVVKDPPSLSINDVSVTEGDSGTKSLNFTVTLSAATSQIVTVNYATADGTAAAGSDYQAANGTLTFNPGDLTKPIGVTINGDQSFEPNESFVVNLSNPAIATISDSQGMGTILNDDAQGGIISFSQANYSVGESDGGLTITVNRSGDTSAAAAVDYATSDAGAPCANPNHLASAKCDFTTTLGTLHFAVGESSKTFTILINQDSFVEGNETFSVSLSNLTGGAVFGAVSSATVTITDDATEPTTNAIDDASNFVRQNYHDFLNREPDASGLAFWTNQITSCGSDQACIETKRINVSAAFFLSIEFQGTGYLVERMYKTAYGDANGVSTFGGAHTLPVPIVRFNEFLPDTQQIGQGVVVGQTGWEAALENNKQAFTAEFVQRSRFTTAYPLSMTPDQFVGQLNTRAGNVLSPGERATAIGWFGGAANTSNLTARAQALRQVAEDTDLNAAESNRAFVLMQFFGFLRRNPNDPQDTDYTGYDFWLTKLNQFNGNFVDAEMVKAFITSSEYRQRFGP